MAKILSVYNRLRAGDYENGNGGQEKGKSTYSVYPRNASINLAGLSRPLTNNAATCSNFLLLVFSVLLLVIDADFWMMCVVSSPCISPASGIPWTKPAFTPIL